MNDISFYMLAYKQKNATEYCLKSIRKYYPNNKIIVFENFSNILFEVCKKYNAIHYFQPINYLSKNNSSIYAHMKLLDDFKLFINQLKKVCELVKTKWVMYLEPDVIIRGKIKKWPKYSVGGHHHNFNIFNNEIKDYINKFRLEKNLEIFDKYYFNCAGGNIINKKDLSIVLNSNWKKYINYSINNYPKYNFCPIRCGDALLSYLFFINGFKIEDWEEYCEIHQTKDQYRLTFAPIVHGFKYYYD
jgi:hypothetical protein